MTTEHVDVLVAGGGPAGMTAGCILARAGLKTLVLERNDTFDREFRGEVLQPRFHKAMQDAGLFEHLRGYPHEEIVGAQIFFEHRRLGRIDLRRVDRRTGSTWAMTQPNLLQALADYGGRSPNFELRFGAAVRGLEGATAGVEGEGWSGEVRARVVIGADGRFSTVRRLAGLELAYENHDLDVVWFILPRPEGYENFFAFFVTPRHNYLMLPKHPGLLQCGLALKPGEFSEIRHQPIADLREELRRAHPVFDAFTRTLEDFSPFRPLKGHTALAAQWARDGLVLIGDAAHTCSPVGGIGVAVAVETALVAADVILEGFEQDDLSARQLGKVQALRESEVRALHGLQARAARTLVGSPGFLRRYAAWGIRLGLWGGLLPRIARGVLTQRRPLPLDPGRIG